MNERPRPWPAVGPVATWGPIALVLTVLVGIGVVASTATPGPTATPTSTPAEALAANPDLPRTWAEAAEAGDTTGDFGDCDPETGQVRFPSVYAPPCVQIPAGDNGGATASGVTAETITVVYYYAPPGDVTSAISGQLDPPAKVVESVRDYTEIFEATFSTSGRHVEIIPFEGTGVGTDETAARADAVEVASEIRAFASIGGPSQSAAYADELAARGVLCLGCGISVPDSAFQRNAPTMWGTLTSPEQYMENIGILLSRQLNGKPAIWAGDPAMHDRPRVFGSINYEQDPPVFGSISKVMEERGNAVGFENRVKLTYILDLAKLPQTAASLIAKLKAAGVTTVTFLGDPIMPIYLTQAATAQDYFPEWIVTGTVLTDTTALARNYDQRQWAHAFGVSTLPVRTVRSDMDAYRIHRWYFGEDPAAYKTAAVFYPNLLQLYQGIHMAGPNLTAETFAGGMFRLPPRGGQPGAAHVSYGDHVDFALTDGDDFIATDDSTLIWWDPEATGPDEQGVDGTGMYRYVAMGARYLPGEMPTELQPFFDPRNTITVYDAQPPELTTPEYPPPEGAPAAP